MFSNSFDGLISTPTQTKATGGLTCGYGYRNAWILETGVTYAPIHLAISVANRGDALVYTYTNNGYSVPFRIKRRLGSGRLASNGTGFWITGGAWLVPNGSGQLGDFSLIGYSYRGRNRVDTLRLSNTALVSSRITGWLSWASTTPSGCRRTWNWVSSAANTGDSARRFNRTCSTRLTAEQSNGLR